MSLYTLENVAMTLGGREVLHIDHLRLEEGRTYSLQGPNGAGKSTLLGVLALLSEPHAGSMCFQGQPVIWTEHALRLLRHDVVLVEQHPIMFSASLRENVGYGLGIRGINGPDRERRVAEAMDLMGIGHLAEAYGPSLSGGETQRAAIARALACRPQVLLLDEPTASVDLENRVVIEKVVGDLRDTGHMTIVLCTHNRSQARALCPEVLHMENGRLAPRGVSNAFSAFFEPSGAQMLGLIGERLVFPCSPEAARTGRVVIDASAISLRPVHSAGVNIGSIMRIDLEGTHVAVTVDVGRPLCVQLPLDGFRTLGVTVADLVQVEIQPDGVRGV